MIALVDRASAKVFEVLIAPGGINTTIAAVSQAANISLPALSESHFFFDNVSSELAEKTGEAKYTGVYIYCEKVANLLTEKFRRFSGHLQMSMEVRLSQDRLKGMDQRLQLYVDALSQTLTQSRGDWGQGLYYSGGYEATFGATKHGGKNFLKIAKIGFRIDASVD